MFDFIYHDIPQQSVTTLTDINSIITFCLICLGNSEKEVEWLLSEAGPKSSITVWGQEILDSATTLKLKNLIQKIGVGRVYLDVYEDLRNAIVEKTSA